MKSQIISGRCRLRSEDFLSAICHELKNPLNAITAFASLLKSGVSDPKEVSEYADEIDKAANDLNEIVEDLLDVGSAASGSFSVDVSNEIDVGLAIQRSVKLNSDYALRRKIDIVTEISEDLRPIRLDVKRMKQILTNLISNAIKYSPENTGIRITAKQDTTGEGTVHGSSLVILISDQGFGMSESQIEQLFTKYRTFENPNSGQVDSFGLGLVITKQLVELQKGTIEIKSKLNEGTEVKLRFPY